MKKSFFPLAFVLLSTGLLHGATVEGDVAALDPKSSTITVLVKGKPLTWRVRPDTVVTINSNKAKFADLAPRMLVKITHSDPAVASKVEATSMTTAGPAAGPRLDENGQPLTGPALRAAIFGVKVMPGGPTNPEGAPTESPLASRLAETKWRMADGKQFTLHTNGTVEGNWPGAQGTWKTTGATTAEWTMRASAKQADKVTFDEKTMSAAWKDDIGMMKSAKRVEK